MAVRLRLRRIGKKKMPLYQIVAADSRAARNGKFLEIIGRYEPLQKPMFMSAKEDRVMYWLKAGARPTDSVRSLFQRMGIWLRWSLESRGVEPEAVAREMEKWQMAQAEKLQRDEERRTRRQAARRKARKAGATTEPTPAAPAETPAAT